VEDDLGLKTPVAADPSGPSATPVVHVVVLAWDRDDHFDEVLTALAVQDYPRSRFLVLTGSDGGSGAGTDLEALVQQRIGGAETAVTNAQSRAELANEVITIGAMSPLILFLDARVALAPDAISRMVDQAVGTNAAIVGPKVVDGRNRRIIRSVGTSVDKLGELAPYAEPEEFDQEQHDSVRDVFAISNVAFMIRADLFSALGGFDARMAMPRAAIDLCWRARIAGARTVIAPQAVAHEYRDAVGGDRDVDAEVRGADARYGQVRSVLSNYSLPHTVAIVPQAIAATVVSMIVALVQGRFGDASASAGAWLRNLVGLPGILSRRRQVGRMRQLPDTEVRRFQTSGFEAVNRRVQKRAEAVDSSERTTRLATATSRARSRRVQITAGVWTVLIGSVLFGSRSLIGGKVPVLNQMVVLPEGPRDLLGSWFSNVRMTGLGGTSYAPTVEAIVGILGIGFLGQMGLLRTALTVGMVLLGAWGMSRFMVPFGSLWARLAAPVTYVAVPLSYNAIVAGSWRGLILIGGLPWVLRWLAEAAGLAPFEPPASNWMWLRNTLVLAVWVALIGAWTPFVMVSVMVMVLGIMLGGILTARPGPIIRLVVSAVTAVLAAFVLHLPWSAELLTGADRMAFFGDARRTTFGGVSIGELLRFHTGPHGSSPLGWGIIVLAGMALLVGRQGRLVWAVRGWMIAIFSFAVAWLEQQQDLTFALPEPEVLLVPGAVGVSLAAAMGFMSFERDLRLYRFGWRQLVPAVSILSLVAVLLAGAGGTFSGGWDSAPVGFGSATLFLDEEAAERARILWIGDADVLPVGARPLDDTLLVPLPPGEPDMAVAVTPARTPQLQELFVGPLGDDRIDFGRTIDTAFRGGTSRLGRMLAPWGVQWIIVVERLAPPIEGAEQPAAATVLASLSEQLDLERTDVRRGMTVYRNVEWSALADPAEVSSLSHRMALIVQLVLWGITAIIIVSGREGGSRRAWFDPSAGPAHAEPLNAEDAASSGPGSKAAEMAGATT